MSEEPLSPTPPMAGLDVERLDSLRDLDPGDTTYLDRAIGNFQVNSVEAEAAIRDAVRAGDVATVKARAHKIAGSALNLGVPRAGEAARAIELAADSGSVEDAPPLLEELAGAMAEGRARLLAYQATYAG
ncbi:Hpt domain-containing protein [Nocardioides sp. 1609]|uniref:Hpt domain-containing protein n=1 Tax=Nocardioides sp. 1609 TaxID=2508327 RepID=UPI001070497B|nr:Hpt domain-containing protein [Nocardioides sp. 1609]